MSCLVAALNVSPYIIHIADYIFFGPLRSVKVFRVFKTLRFKSIILNIFQLFDHFEECVFDLDFSCIFLKLQHDSLAFVAGLKGLLIRVHYPKLRNIVHTISL